MALLQNSSPILIAHRVSDVARDFLSLTKALTTEERFALQVPPTAFQDEFTRFKLWAGNIAAHRRGRRSLEYRLRDAEHLKSEVHNLLNALTAALRNSLEIVTGERVPWDALEDSDSDSETESNMSDDDLQGDTELKQLLSTAKTMVTSLFRLSMAIRDPAPTSQSTRTITADKSYFENHDVLHVQAKYPACPEYLVNRLGRAISARRQYLTYREEHHSKLSKGSEKLGLDESRTEHTNNSTEATPMPALDRQQSFNALDEDDSISQTSFATSINAAIRVPSLPKEARDKEFFECPLCFMIVSIHSKAAWKQHVYRDLHPYCCTFDSCTTADRLYDSRHEWFQHELEAHRTTWQCIQGCDMTFATQDEFDQHVRRCHTGFVEMLPTIKRTSARTANVTEQVHCLLCQKRMSLRSLQKHIAYHQQQLALFALPPNVDETEEELDEDDEGLIGESSDKHEDSEMDESDHDSEENEAPEEVGVKATAPEDVISPPQWPHSPRRKNPIRQLPSGEFERDDNHSDSDIEIANPATEYENPTRKPIEEKKKQSRLAQHFEELSREFQNERIRERETLEYTAHSKDEESQHQAQLLVKNENMRSQQHVLNSINEEGAGYKDLEPLPRRRSSSTDFVSPISDVELGPPPSIRGFDKINNNVSQRLGRSSFVDGSRKVPSHVPDADVQYRPQRESVNPEYDQRRPVYIDDSVKEHDALRPKTFIEWNEAIEERDKFIAEMTEDGSKATTIKMEYDRKKRGLERWHPPGISKENLEERNTIMDEMDKSKEEEEKERKLLIEEQRTKTEKAVMKAQDSVVQDKTGKKTQVDEHETTMRDRLSQFGFGEAEIESMVQPKDRLQEEESTATKSPLPVSGPTYSKIHKNHLDIETLHYYDIPYEYDSNPSYVIVLRELSSRETDVLFEHTRRLRRVDKARMADPNVVADIAEQVNVDVGGETKMTHTDHDRNANLSVSLKDGNGRIADKSGDSPPGPLAATSSRRPAAANVASSGFDWTVNQYVAPEIFKEQGLVSGESAEDEKREDLIRRKLELKYIRDRGKREAEAERLADVEKRLQETPGNPMVDSSEGTQTSTSALPQSSESKRRPVQIHDEHTKRRNLERAGNFAQENKNQVRLDIDRAESRAIERAENLLAQKEKDRAEVREEARLHAQKELERLKSVPSNPSIKRSRRGSITITRTERDEQQQLIAADLYRMQNEARAAEAREQAELAATLSVRGEPESSERDAFKSQRQDRSSSVTPRPQVEVGNSRSRRRPARYDFSARIEVNDSRSNRPRSYDDRGKASTEYSREQQDHALEESHFDTETQESPNVAPEARIEVPDSRSNRRQTSSAYDTPRARIEVNNSRSTRRPARSLYDTSRARVEVNNSKSNRTQSYQAYEKAQAEYYREQLYIAERNRQRPALRNPDEQRQRHTSGLFDYYTSDDEESEEEEEEAPLAPRLARRRAGNQEHGREVIAAEEYIMSTRGSRDSYADSMERASRRRPRRPSPPSNSGSSGGKRSISPSEQSSRLGMTNNTNNEIRMRVDSGEPINLQFSGDMEGRTLQLVPAGNGMADIVIGNRRSSPVDSKATRDREIASYRENASIRSTPVESREPRNREGGIRTRRNSNPLERRGGVNIRSDMCERHRRSRTKCDPNTCPDNRLYKTRQIARQEAAHADDDWEQDRRLNMTRASTREPRARGSKGIPSSSTTASDELNADPPPQRTTDH
ncbi:hypothetical protein CC86DRAFT_28104 [Ophiobolus disseminans]|uniref:C2H2-type domain-containing protein n=1 Tax=Ophiobolus disseminans TaxID=1469910 RepID=A0A6A7A0N2_9PLEO|nr:hypothetical protein CC86DRAFT_28104 [Ophiobolus disseminans]